MLLTPGMYVTLDSRTKRGYSFSGRRGHRAMLVAVEGRTAIVRPFRHRRNEKVPLESLTPWVAGNAEHAPKPRGPEIVVPVFPPNRKLVKVPATGGL